MTQQKGRVCISNMLMWWSVWRQRQAGMGEKDISQRQMSFAFQRGKERDNLKIILKAKELVAGKNRKMERCRQ